MLTPNTDAPAAAATIGLPLAAIVAATMLVILVGAMATGGLLTRPPAAAAAEHHAPRGVVRVTFEPRLAGFQLPTI